MQILQGKKTPVILISGVVQHMKVCVTFPQSLLIDILAMAQMEELPLSLRNMISPFVFILHNCRASL